MSRNRKKKKQNHQTRKTRREAPIPQRSADETYQQACRLAEQGHCDEARALLAQLQTTETEPRMKALIANDLATILALQGDLKGACAGFEAALAVRADCEPAKANLAFLQEYTSADCVSPVSVVPVPEFPSAPTSDELPQRVQSPGSEAPVRIAILSFLFNWPSTGGGNVHTYELPQFLAKAGYEVRHFYARYAPWGIGCVETALPYPSTALDFDESTWNAPDIQARFRHALKKFEPDHVIITDSWNIKPLLAEAASEYPYILRFQAMECLCPLNNLRLLVDGDGRVRQCPLHQLANPSECRQCINVRGARSGSLHQLERALSGVGSAEYHQKLLRSFRDAEAVLVVNPLHEAMLSPYSNCVRVVTAGMDPSRFPWPPPEGPASKSTGKAQLLFAGLVEEMIKGFTILHQACAMLWERRQDFELVATGDPWGQVDPFTRFIGWQSQEQLPHHLWKSDILVMPTIAQDALGRTAVEAMAAGRPVVASRLGGLPFTVADGATGLLCNAGDPRDLAQKLEHLLNDVELRDQMGRAGRRRFEEHYDWDVIVESHYRPLLAASRSAQTRPSSAGIHPTSLVPRARDGTLPSEIRGGSRTGYVPVFPSDINHEELIDQLSQSLGTEREQVAKKFLSYHAYHLSKRYAETLGEAKTLSFEEAFVLYVILGIVNPRVIVEIGTQHGKSTRRILDMKNLLGLNSSVVCVDQVDEVRFFAPEEANLIVQNVAGRFRQDILLKYHPDLIFCDVHGYGLLHEIVTQTLALAPDCVLVLHDCGRGLCNRQMTIGKDDPAVTSLTGVWERHVLADVFGLADPLDEQLDRCVVGSTGHSFRIFPTTHGLGVLLSSRFGNHRRGE